MSFNLNITLRDAVRGFTNIIDQFGPDHKATPPEGSSGTCVYALVNQYGALVPVCIVGQFFANLGLLRVLLDPDHHESNSVFAEANECNLAGLSSKVRAVLDGHGITVDDDAWTFMGYAQSQQDRNHTWKESVEYAARRLDEDGLVTLVPTSYTESLLATFGEN